MSTPYKFSLPSTFPSHYFLRQPIFHFVVQGSQVSRLIETYHYLEKVDPITDFGVHFN
jgi:hypothetical protein